MNTQLALSPFQLSADNPWPGLQSFDEASRAFFFGMHAETDALFRLVRRETLTLFYGRSGLGKTSLLQAGLFPRLRDANLLPVPIRLDYGTLPLVSQVKQAIANALSEAGIDARPPAETESLWEYFHSSEVDFWDAENRLVTLVLVFDQFEERFTLGRQLAETDAQADVCLAELSQLIENRPPPLLKAEFEARVDAVGGYDFDKRSCKVVLSLREDFLPELENLRDRFPSILENSLRLQAMREAQAMEVVLGPGSHLVNEQVAAEIVRFVCRTDQQAHVCCAVEPVLLSVVLYGLNQRRRQNQQPTITSDLLLGNREQILDDFYEDALKGLPASARLLVEDGLLTSAGRRDTLAWEDARAEFGVEEQVVLTLIDRHLVRREDRSDGARIELVHDRLAEVARKHRDSRREQESQARELAHLQARQAELEREKEIHRRKSRRLLVACVALALFGTLVTGYLIRDRYLHVWRHETYFRNCAERNGIFEGVGPLTKEQASRRSSSFKFIRRGASGPVLRVQAVDSEGRLTHRHSAGTYIKFKPAVNVYSAFGIDENPSRECQWEFVQDEAREIAYQLAYDKNGTRVWGLAYSPSLSRGLQKVAHFVGPDGLPNIHTKSAAEYIRIEYWPDGLEKQLSYLDRTGKPRSGPGGTYAEHYDYDALGLTKRVVSMDANGHPMINNDGVAILEFGRDAMGNVTERIALDVAGKPTLTRDGWSRIVMTYDEYGNENEETYFDPSGRPCMTKDGYANAKVKDDSHGNAIEVAYFDTNDRSCLEKRFGVAKVTSKFDERGNQIEVTCFGANGKPCLSKFGNSKETHKFDERGNLIEAADFDTDGKPCLNTIGISKVTCKYDERSNLLASEWYGIDGRRRLTKDGFAKMTADYDERGNQVGFAFFGLGDEPAINKSDGTHRVKMSYDEPGNCIAWEFYGVDGKPCMAKDGYAKATADYDERGNQVAWACFGLHDKPAIKKADGTHGVKKSYDSRGNCIAREYYDVDGKRCLTKDGYAKETDIYDERGNRIEEAYFDERGEAVRNTDGYARVAKSYDARGNVIGAAYFDERGEPVRSNDGFVRFTASYDERDNKIELATFDEGGKPAQRKEGYARFTASYDERGNQIEGAYFDEAGKPVRTTDGYARFTASYDARGNVIGAAYFDERGEPVRSNDGFVRFTASYDERDNKIELATFDEGGKPAQRKEGYARFTASYDERGNQIEGAYFDEAGKAVRTTDGYARFTASYDERGNQVAWACFGLGDEPAINKSDGTHRVKMSYDEPGNCIAWEFYGVDGKPCMAKDGYARITAKYDDFGHRVEEVKFDLTGNSTVKKYDQRGAQSEEAYLDKAGKPTTNENGIARWTATYEGMNPADVTYFDRNGKPTAVQVYVVEVTPDGQGKEAGLMSGDVLVSYDGKAIRNDVELTAWVHTPGNTPRELVISRDGRCISFKMKPGIMGVRTSARAAPGPFGADSNAPPRSN